MVQPPIVVSVSPLANESAASAVNVVSVTFDKNMNSATTGSFRVYGSQTGKVSGTYAGGGTTSLSFDPAGNFKPGEEIEVTLTQSLTSTSGAGLDQPYVYRFWVETGGGTGVFLDEQTVPGQVGASALAAGDWDGDDDLDLAVGNFGANTVVILKNDGSGTFTPSSTIAGQVDAICLVAGDWDGDGNLDLAVGNFATNSVAILRNNGTGSFSSLSAIAGQIGISALAAGDWGGDGNLDLAAVDNGSDSVQILKNQP